MRRPKSAGAVIKVCPLVKWPFSTWLSGDVFMAVGHQKISRVLRLATVLLFLLALPLPAIFKHGPPWKATESCGWDVPGYSMLLSFPYVLLHLAWWANPVWLLGVLTLFRRKCVWAWWCGLVATDFALLVMVIGPFPPDSFDFKDLYSGYYVWLGSMGCLWLTATWDLMASRWKRTMDRKEKQGQVS